MAVRDYQKWSDGETLFFDDGVFATVLEKEEKDKDGNLMYEIIVEQMDEKTGEVQLLEAVLVPETQVDFMLEEIEYESRYWNKSVHFEEMWHDDQYIRVYYDDYGFEVGMEVLSGRKPKEEKSIFDAYFEMENA